MKYGVWQGPVQDSTGAVVPNADITVRGPGGVLLSVYADRNGDTPLGNPFTADEEGQVKFYVRPGRIEITAQAGGFIRVHDDVVTLEDYAGFNLVDEGEPTRELLLSDNGAVIQNVTGDSLTIDVPNNADVAFPPGATIYFHQPPGSGSISINAMDAASINYPAGNIPETGGDGSTIALMLIDPDNNYWILVGQMGAA